MALEHFFSALTCEGRHCHVELDYTDIDGVENVIAQVFYLEDPSDPESYNAGSEDESYCFTKDDCDIEDFEAVEKKVKDILASSIPAASSFVNGDLPAVRSERPWDCGGRSGDGTPAYV